ncbi:MAG TPA: aspartate aminotransferase family protein [Candidatus Altiarchaeales archaeon]|nr:aspartate aminotransferase family protein [Candidatus Altiarchaeales archaeon]
MNQKEIEKLEKRVYANTFSRLPVTVVKGRGVYAYDIDGKEYLDMFAGIAVNSLGHCHPDVLEIIKRQSEKLIHISNWFYTLPQLELSELLIKITSLRKVFITNDGTEAVESAIKLARKVTGKKEIIAMENAFHGRTMGSLSLTWGKRYREVFEPLVPEMKFAKFNDIDSLKKSMREKTAAVIVEPIQGESGVIMPDEDYLKDVREITYERDVLLIVDEIQTGFGRTGTMFAFQQSGIEPDILCIAKGMGSGFPIGAIVYNCDDFEPGQHGGTFIGNPLACSVAKTVIEVILRDNLIENCREVGRYLLKKLLERGLEARGKGLMIGIDVGNGRKTVLELIKKGILTIYSNDTVRILPPLVIEKKHADQFLSAIDLVKC